MKISSSDNEAIAYCFVDYRQGSIQERTGKKKVNQDVVPNEEGSQLGNRREKKMYFSAWRYSTGDRLVLI